MGSIYKNGIAYASGGSGGASDSGWIELQLVDFTGTCFYRKVDSIITLQLTGSLNTSLGTGTYKLIGVLPEGFRPKVCASIQGGSLNKWEYGLRIDSEGNINIVNYASTSIGQSSVLMFDTAFYAA